MAFLSPTPSIMSGLDPRAQQLIQDARNMGLGEDEIAQMLDSSGFNPMEYANDLYAPSTPLQSKEPGSTIPPQVAQTLAAKPGMEPTFAPPAPPTLNKARIGTGDESYGDYSPDVFNQRFNDAADAYGVPQDIAQGMLNTENTTRNPYAINGQGSTAIGLGQLTEAARADYNKAHDTNFTREDFFDPDLNTDATFWYLTTRDGATIQDKVRAYNQGNGGARQGLGYDYLAKVTGGAAPGMTTPDGTSAAAPPPAYDDLPTEAIPPTSPGMRGDILGAEPGGEVDTTSESPGFMDSLGTTILGEKDKPSFFGKLMGALSGPMGEGLMGMGAGILGARGTYGNTFQAIGQGGEKGLEAYGYAQRRAQRDREALAAQKRLEVQDANAVITRDQQAFANDLSLIQTLTKNGQYKAASAYIARSPRLRERFGPDMKPEFFAGEGEKPDIHFYPDRIIAVDKKTLQATEIKVPGGPLKKDDEVNGIVTVKDGKKVLMNPRDGRVISELGSDDTREVNGVVKTEINERGQPVNRLYDPRTGKLIETLGIPYDDSQSVEIQNPDGTVMRVGKSQKGARTGLPQARENKLWEHYDTWRNAKYAGEQLIGTRDEDGVLRGGALNKFDIGLLGDLRKYTFGALSQADAATQLLGSSLEAGSKRFIEENMKRPVVRGDFTESRWFNPNQPLIEYYGSMLTAIEAMSKNPDGRISDADMEIARQTLGLQGDWFTNIDVVRAKVAEALKFAEQKGVRAAEQLKIDPETGMPLAEDGSPSPAAEKTTTSKSGPTLADTPLPPPPVEPPAAELARARQLVKKGEVLLFNPKNPPGTQFGAGKPEDAKDGWQVVP